MDKSDIFEKIRKIRVMPLFYHSDHKVSGAVMMTVFNGGIELPEFTNRGENALPVFKELKEIQADSFPGNY